MEREGRVFGNEGKNCFLGREFLANPENFVRLFLLPATVFELAVKESSVKLGNDLKELLIRLSLGKGLLGRC